MSKPLKAILGCLGILVLIAFLSLTRFGMLIHLFYYDTFSFPLWIAPDEVQEAVAEVLDKEEDVILINMDAFDFEHINVLTDRRVFQIEGIGYGISQEVPLKDIRSASIDDADKRFMIVERSDDQKERMFFVGSPHGFCRKLNRIIARGRS